LRNAEYCIFNQQYSKEEYEALVPQIIGHMKKTGEYGEFFPIRLSPFAYNESIANEYDPLSKQEALAMGFQWADEVPSTVGKETISYDQLPKNPDEFSEALLPHILKCVTCGRNYKLIQKEINFYKRMHLPLPQECFNCRHARRMAMRNLRNLWAGVCSNCAKHIETSYAPESQKEFKIYCETCYQNEVA
jgi:hypothetical protein